MKNVCMKLYTCFVGKLSNTKKKKMLQRRNSEMPVGQEEGAKKPISRAKSLHELDIKKNNSDGTNVLDELLQCGICYERLLDSRMLPCQHTFCLSCLQGYMKTITEKMMKKRLNPPSTDEIKAIMVKIPIPLPCPMCQKTTNVNGFESLIDLPKNIYIDNLLKLMEFQCTSPTSTSSPTLRCFKCQTICPLPGRSCGHCLQIYCSVCWTEHLSVLKLNISNLLKQLSETEIKLSDSVDDFKKQCQNVSVNIEKVTNNHILKIKEKEQNSLRQLDEIKISEQDNVEQLKSRIKNISEEIQSLKFDDIRNEDQKVNIFMSYHRTTSKVLDDVLRWSDSQIVFDENTFKVTHTNQIYLDKTNSSEIADSSLKSIEGTSSYYREQAFMVKLVWNKCPRPAGLGIPPWAPHLLYIATTNRKVVLIMDRNMSKIIAKLSCPEMHYPQGIAFCEQRLEVYVTDKWKHCIHVFNHEGDYVRTLSNLGSGKGELRSPEGIAVTHNNNLVVCDSGNDRVLILNPDDGEQISLLAGSAHRTPFQSPTGVAVFGERIIISDTGNHNIKVYATTGKILYEFGTVGSGKGQFRTAEVVVCDSMGFIFVGDSGNARIQIFTPDGKFLRELCSQGKSSEKFLWISGLAVTSQLEIITTDYKQKCLQIFNNYSKL